MMTVFEKSMFTEALKTEAAATLAQTVLRVHTDSRSIRAGDLFFAISGDRFDGHQFVANSLEKGAVAAVIQRDKAHLLTISQTDPRLIVVENSLAALRELARLYRLSLKIPVIAIGGSNGKTTTKELTHFALELFHGPRAVFKTKKSENSILGIALSLLQIRQEKMAVIEVGIDEPGWMDQHLEIVQPTHGLITTIHEEHLEKLKNIEIVAQEELKLLQFLKSHQGGFAANLDSPWIKSQNFPAQYLTYSLQATAHLEARYRPPNTLQVFGLEMRYPLPGLHNAQNLLAAISITRLLHPELRLEDLVELRQALPSFRGEDHRSLWLESARGVKVFDDCYNANPISMESALQTFIEIAAGHPLIAVLGDMRELGESALTAHQRIINLAGVMGFQHIFLHGPEFIRAAESLLIAPEGVQIFERLEDLTEELERVLQPGHAILLKGSRGMKMERVLDAFEDL